MGPVRPRANGCLEDTQMGFLMPKPAPIIVQTAAEGTVPKAPEPPTPMSAPARAPGGSQRQRQPSFLGNAATANRPGIPAYGEGGLGAPGGMGAGTPGFGSKTLLGQ
jgi:hypothetical protein